MLMKVKSSLTYKWLYEWICTTGERTEIKVSKLINAPNEYSYLANDFRKYLFGSICASTLLLSPKYAEHWNSRWLKYKRSEMHVSQRNLFFFIASAEKSASLFSIKIQNEKGDQWHYSTIDLMISLSFVRARRRILADPFINEALSLLCRFSIQPSLIPT